MGVMLDCPDAKALSHFYAELLGKPVTYEADGVAMIGEDGAQPVMFQQVEQYTAPRWPDPAYPQQIHLDVTVQDVDAAERAALDIGATRLDSAGPNWRVYADPPASPSAGVDGLGTRSLGWPTRRTGQVVQPSCSSFLGLGAAVRMAVITAAAPRTPAGGSKTRAGSW